MCATISTAPVPASVVTQVMSPAASNFGRSSRVSSAILSEDTETSRENCAVLTSAHQGHETGLFGGIVPEQAGEAAGDGLRAGLADAANRHAGMLGFDHHRDAARLEDVLDGRSDLGGEMLLRLQAPCENIDE